MAYSKQTWENLPNQTTPITAERLNHMEDGIYEASQGGSNIEIYNEYNESTTDGYSCNYVNELNTYSTDEIRVGTWVDGKPIYRKVFNIGTLPNAAIKDTAHGLTNIEVKKIYGYSKRANDNFYVPLPFSSENTSGYNIALSVLNDYIRIATGTDRTAFTETYVTLEYTKTTD